MFYLPITLFGTILVRPVKENILVREYAHPNANVLFKVSKNKVYELLYCDIYGWCKIRNIGFIAKNKLLIYEVKNDRYLNRIKVRVKKKKSSTFKQPIKKIPCKKLKQVDLSNYKVLNKSNKNKLLKKYLNQCITEELIKNILNSLSTKYLDDGYITTKAYLKPQNINDGQIYILILNGEIEDIIHEETKESSLRIKTAFIFQKDRPLNLRDLETSLESINRVPSSDATFNIMPSNTQGKSIIEVKTKKTFPIHLTLGVSGEKRIKDKNPNLTAVLSFDNVLRINDIFTYKLNGTSIQKEYQSTKGSEFNYSFPLGSYIYDLTQSYTSYRTGVIGLNGTYLSNGDTKGSKFGVSKVLNRNKNNKFTGSFSIYHKDTKNYFINELIEVSSYKTTLFEASLSHVYIKNWGTINTIYTFYKGTSWFGAKEDNSFNTQESDDKGRQKLEFLKHTLDASLNYYLNDNTYVLSSNFHLQTTDDHLYNNDKLKVGSSYTVRGYSSPNYSGNNGYYIKNDVTKTFNVNVNNNVLKDISIFVGLDYGKVKCEDDNIDMCGEIYGSTIGIKTNAKTLSSNFTWEKAIKHIKKDQKIHSIFNYNLNIKF